MFHHFSSNTTAFWENETFTTETKGQLIDWNMTIFVPFTTETNSMHGSNFRGKQSWSKSMTRPGEPWIPPSKKKMAQGGTPPGINWFIGHRLVGG
jgi:hypothetical protein